MINEYILESMKDRHEAAWYLDSYYIAVMEDGGTSPQSEGLFTKFVNKIKEIIEKIKSFFTKKDNMPTQEQLKNLGPGTPEGNQAAKNTQAEVEDVLASTNKIVAAKKKLLSHFKGKSDAEKKASLDNLDDLVAACEKREKRDKIIRAAYFGTIGANVAIGLVRYLTTVPKRMDETKRILGGIETGEGLDAKDLRRLKRADNVVLRFFSYLQSIVPAAIDGIERSTASHLMNDNYDKGLSNDYNYRVASGLSNFDKNSYATYTSRNTINAFKAKISGPMNEMLEQINRQDLKKLINDCKYSDVDVHHMNDLITKLSGDCKRSINTSANRVFTHGYTDKTTYDKRMDNRGFAELRKAVLEFNTTYSTIRICAARYNLKLKYIELPYPTVDDFKFKTPEKPSNKKSKVTDKSSSDSGDTEK